MVAGGTTREALSHLLGFLTSTRHKSHLDNQISVREGLLLLAVTCQQSTFQNLYLLFSPTFSILLLLKKSRSDGTVYTSNLYKKEKKNFHHTYLSLWQKSHVRKMIDFSRHFSTLLTFSLLFAFQVKNHINALFVEKLLVNLQISLLIVENTPGTNLSHAIFVEEVFR